MQFLAFRRTRSSLNIRKGTTALQKEQQIHWLRNVIYQSLHFLLKINASIKYPVNSGLGAVEKSMRLYSALAFLPVSFLALL